MHRLTRAQCRQIDAAARDVYHMPTMLLMENAARAVASAACQMLNNECIGSILILCGGGNNGGDGLAVARHLHNRGADVTIGLTVDPSKYTGDALVNWKIVEAMKLRAQPFNAAMIEAEAPMLVIDAIFGTGLTDAPRDPFPQIASMLDRSGCPVLAVDLPSGLDCDTGVPPGACIRATWTVTFVAEKVGFAKPEARAVLGRVIVGDIGCPRELIQTVTDSRKN